MFNAKQVSIVTAFHLVSCSSFAEVFPLLSDLKYNTNGNLAFETWEKVLILCYLSFPKHCFFHFKNTDWDSSNAILTVFYSCSVAIGTVPFKDLTSKQWQWQPYENLFLEKKKKRKKEKKKNRKSAIGLSYTSMVWFFW